MALGEAQSAATLATIKGDKSHRVATKVLRVYKRRVRKNRQAAHEVALVDTREETPFSCLALISDGSPAHNSKTEF